MIRSFQDIGGIWAQFWSFVQQPLGLPKNIIDVVQMTPRVQISLSPEKKVAY